MGDAEQFEKAMRRLLQEVFAFIRRQVGGKVSDDDLLKMTQAVIEKMQKGVGPATWESASHGRIQSLKKAANLYKPFRVVGSIAEIRDPELVNVPTGYGDFIQSESTCMMIRDLEGDEIWALDVVGEEISAVHELRRTGRQIEFLCMPVDLPIRLDAKRPDKFVGTGRRQFFAHVLDARQSTSVLDLVGASAAERMEAEELLKDLIDSGTSPYDFVFQQLVTNLNIVGLDAFPELRDLVRFAVLQALSAGRIDHAPARLHLLIVGPPGQGKKLVGLAARILNPVCVELSPSKVSVAGLVGASRRTAGGWVSQPGALPLASNGVAALQDAHGWDGAAMRRIAPTLQELMEDGVVRDSVAGGQRRSAETALLIDLNRATQVTSHGDAVQEAALLRIRPLLSRFDCIVEITPNMERSRVVSKQLYDSLQHASGSLDDEPWVRELRLLVALLRDRHPQVDLNEVRGLMAMVHDDVFAQNQVNFDRIPEATDIPARLAISFARLVSASARSRDSSVAEACDVDVATAFINHKLSFLRVNGTKYPASVTGSTSAQSRADWFAQYAGREVRSQDVADDYTATTGQGMSERTARRHLQRRGAVRTTKGQYFLPPGPAAPGTP